MSRKDRTRKGEETPSQRLIEAAIRRRPVEAMVVGPACSIVAVEVQQEDPILKRLLEQWMEAFVHGDLDRLERVDGVLDYIGVVRSAAATSARCS